MTVGELLRAEVAADPRTAKEIAEAAGYSRTQTYNVFRGDTIPTTKTIEAFARALDVHPGCLLPPGLSPLQRKAVAATATGGYESVRALTALIQEILADLE